MAIAAIEHLALFPYMITVKRTASRTWSCAICTMGLFPTCLKGLSFGIRSHYTQLAPALDGCMRGIIHEIETG
jgi:hypothetical protein